MPPSASFRSFRLERYFAAHEFAVKHLLCCSDAQPLSQRELLGLADAECLQLWDSLGLGYTESQGLPLLRDEIAKQYAGGVSRAQVLCCAPQEGILLSHALLKPGDELVVTTPGYQSATSLAEDMGVTVHCWKPRRAADGSLHFAVDDLSALVSSKTRMIHVNFPQNPTGCCPTRAEWAEIVEVARASNAILFSDEVYRGLKPDPADELPPAADLYERAISLGALSKAHGLAGLRAGWLVTRDADLYSTLQEGKDFTTICACAPGEILALIALRASERILEKNRRLLSSNLELVAVFMAKWAAVFEWPRPAAGSVCWPRLRSAEPVDAFCLRVLRGCGVLLLPSTCYDHGIEGEEAARFRLGFGRTDCGAVLAVLDGWLTSGGATAPA